MVKIRNDNNIVSIYNNFVSYYLVFFFDDQVNNHDNNLQDKRTKIIFLVNWGLENLSDNSIWKKWKIYS